MDQLMKWLAENWQDVIGLCIPLIVTVMVTVFLHRRVYQAEENKRKLDCIIKTMDSTPDYDDPQALFEILSVPFLVFNDSKHVRRLINQYIEDTWSIVEKARYGTAVTTGGVKGLLERARRSSSLAHWIETLPRQRVVGPNIRDVFVAMCSDIGIEDMGAACTNYWPLIRGEHEQTMRRVQERNQREADL